MQDIRTQYDLDRLPQPRLIFTAKPWVRRLTTFLLAAGAALGIASAIDVAGPGAAYYVTGTLIAAAVCVLALVLGRPYDWRAWVKVAASLDGLYIAGNRGRLVFVPWHDVVNIAAVRIDPGKGGPRNFPRLTLRLSEADWVRFGRMSGIKGEGPVRHFVFSAPGDTAEATVERLKTFRGDKG